MKNSARRHTTKKEKEKNQRETGRGQAVDRGAWPRRTLSVRSSLLPDRCGTRARPFRPSGRTGPLVGVDGPEGEARWLRIVLDPVFLS